MPTLDETAYPRLPAQPGERELLGVYTPSPAERQLASRVSREPTSTFGFLVLLKTFQRLGYFVMLRDVPEPIQAQVRASLGLLMTPGLAGYDESGTRSRHLALIRDHLGVRPFSPEGPAVLEAALRSLAHSKQDLRDLINGAIELLIKERLELPGFTVLEDTARRVRAQVQHELFRQVHDLLDGQALARLAELLVAPGLKLNTTRWNDLKREPGRPTLIHVREWLTHQCWAGCGWTFSSVGCSRKPSCCTLPRRPRA